MIHLLQGKSLANLSSYAIAKWIGLYYTSNSSIGDCFEVIPS
ncbi:hypothetical protein ADICYQ_4822 [Cyclobacterium qasimii M12-11B]|uniref:Uncharacterized protein n=1 Tax=Cyclobacterium qasimii M12-11B TaxID=641524 RepID=S7WHA2_9BACT|nr:hypothetical protein ADICYQ_4822 [Cyclobacterium qasimii M12-11B]